MKEKCLWLTYVHGLLIFNQMSWLTIIHVDYSSTVATAEISSTCSYFIGTMTYAEKKLNILISSFLDIRYQKTRDNIHESKAQEIYKETIIDKYGCVHKNYRKSYQS